MGKMFTLVLLGAIAALAYSQKPEVERYLNMRKM